MAWSNNLFYGLFLSQIFLISYYIPKKLLDRMRYVFQTYPPAAYPKLYPRPSEHYKMAHAAYRIANGIIIAIGFLTLFLIVFVIDHSTFADDGYISEAFPAAYGMLQFLPLMVVEFTEYSHLKLMRKVNSSPKRRAELRRRGLADFVSMKLFGLTLAVLVACVFYDFYVHDFTVSWGHDTVQRTIVLAVTNSFLLVVGAWNLYGRKLNPHQSTNNRTQHTAANVKSLLYVSMALSVFLMTEAADDAYDIDFLGAIIMCVYFQAITLLSVGIIIRDIKPGDIDFEVYRSDAATT